MLNREALKAASDAPEDWDTAVDIIEDRNKRQVAECGSDRMRDHLPVDATVLNEAEHLRELN